MGIFSLTQELAIDLGTANTLIIYNGKVVVDEPSIVALDVHTGKLVAIGQQARQMHEKTNPNIKTIRPLKDGVIADFNATELMLRGMIKKVKTSGSLFAPSLRMVICIPSGSTNVEIRAVRDSAEHAGGREVYMIYEPMAAALGAGLDVEAPEGNMVIDIGGGTSEIACISLGGIVCSESINTAGDVFTNDIQSYVRQQHNIRIGERRAEDGRYRKNHFIRNENRLIFFSAIPVPRAMARSGSSAMWNGMPVFSFSRRSSPLISAPPPAR